MVIDEDDLIYTESFRSLCTYDCVIDGIENIPEKGILWMPNDGIKQLFEQIELNNHPAASYVVIGTSDYGLFYQHEAPVNPDIVKTIAKEDFHEFNTTFDKYIPLVMGPACRPELCQPQHKYSLRCYHFTHATFNDIPKAVHHWFSSNLNIVEDRVSCIPLGLLKPTAFIHSFDKKKLLYINLSDITIERLNLKNYFINEDPQWCTFKDKVSHDEYLQDLSEHAFALCPEGNSRDSFRLIECVMSGTIPVVTISTWANHFKGCPFLFVSDQLGITRELLVKSLQELPKLKFNLNKLKYTWWRDQIMSKWNEIKN